VLYSSSYSNNAHVLITWRIRFEGRGRRTQPSKHRRLFSTVNFTSMIS